MPAAISTASASFFYELLTGERPFRGNRRMLILQVLEDEPRPPRQLNDKIPRDLETICLKAMAKSPARRYATRGSWPTTCGAIWAASRSAPDPIGRIERLRHWCRRNPVAASLLIAVSLGSAFGLWHLSRLSEQLVRIDGARERGPAGRDARRRQRPLYARRSSSGSSPTGSSVTHDYASKKGAIPLPATFTIESGERIGERSKTGMLFRLYSDYPFRSRKDGGPHDDFERVALADLRRNPDNPFYRFEVFQNRPSLRYATARRMQADCIGCHNNDTNSTKRDWKVGRRRRRPGDHPPAGPGHRPHARGTARKLRADGGGFRGPAGSLRAGPRCPVTAVEVRSANAGAGKSRVTLPR